MQKIISAKKLGNNSLNFFACSLDVKSGDKVVVEVDEFQTIVVVKDIETNVTKPAEEFGKVIRIASEADLKKYENLEKKAKTELPSFKTKSLELGLMMKFISAEYSLDGSKILIMFSSEERVDFRQLLKELASSLKTRIELRQIGQRDEVKFLGGVGPCGEPCCCARFLKDFEHVTVKQAKVQGLSLSPTKINGVCGRLMCCLGYEAKMYEELLSKMPKINSEVETPNGKGIVVYNDILRERVSVKRQAEGDTIVVEVFELYDLKGFGKKPEEPKVQEKQNKDVKFNKHNPNFEKKDKNNNRSEQNAKEMPIQMNLGSEDKSNNAQEKKFKNKNRRFFNKNNKK